ncbi:MAG: GNAT family N-acetyltransferase [Chitinophagales bacterium]
MNSTEKMTKKVNYKEKVLDSFTGTDILYTNNKIAQFLYDHLDQYGDKKEDILRAVNYAFKKHEMKGGFIVLGLDDDEIIGVVVINETGMSGYIPENILVYIAVNSDYRGQGIGKRLMETALRRAKGAVALHVEPDNPAKFLYEKMGFTNKYLEMRYQKK